MIKNLKIYFTKNKTNWYLYDFANSIVFINILLYYPLLIVNDMGGKDYLISVPVAFASILLLFFLPKIGNKTDVLNNKTNALFYYTVLSCVSILALALFSFTNLQTLNIILVTLCYFAFYFFYQISLSIYNSLLQDVTSKEDKDVTSGIGIVFGQLGNIFGLLMAMAIFGSTFYLQEINNKSFVLLISSILFIFLGYIVYRNLKSLKSEKNLNTQNLSYKTLFSELKNNNKIKWFLIAYYLYIDSILTFQLFISLYLTKGLGFNEKIVTTIGLLSLVVTIIGAFLSGQITKYFKKINVLRYGIMAWCLIFIAMALVTSKLQLYIVVVANGLLFGILAATARVYFSELVPANEQGKYFSIFTIFERSASVIGPLCWSGLSLLLIQYTTESNTIRLNILFLSFFVLLSYFAFKKHLRYAKGDN